MQLRSLPAPGACSLWQVDLRMRPTAADWALLDEQEGARAQRFAFTRDRERFVAAHAALRRVLAARINQPPAGLHLDAGPFGKPVLRQDPTLAFNLSHSGAMGLIALQRGVPLGVDVEVLREVPELDEMAHACFTRDECRALALLRPWAQQRAFLRCWTRKEACLKAVGLGLHLAPNRFEVGIAADSRTVRLPLPDGEATLTLHSFDIGADAVGALALWQATTGSTHAPETECEVFAP